ncbi:MAG: hypothetical protein M3405_10880 [Acidobacteriota bacterium]|jgi:hypothetical protein|nr:hypothetical protein [Acidobacteriota bacterium]
MSTSIQEIHRSAANAENLEFIQDGRISIADVFLSLVKHPIQILKRWNWKSALLGAILRASFYFTVYKASRESWIVTLVAVMVEFSFRFFTSGISGALVQSFRKAKPAWLATLIVSVSLPAFSHTIEFFTHYWQEKYFAHVFPPSVNKSRELAFVYSVMLSVLSALFNIFMMRKGVLLVGAGKETKSLRDDFKMIPLLIYEFTLFLPKQIIQFLKDFKFHYAIGSFLLFGFIVGTVLGTIRGKWSWAYYTTIGAWGILLGFIILVFIGQQIHKKMTKG